jgi:hypothetical protein
LIDPVQPSRARLPAHIRDRLEALEAYPTKIIDQPADRTKEIPTRAPKMTQT